MKATRFLILASTLVLGSSFAVAGPGPQYWQNRFRQEKKDQVQEAKQDSSATATKTDSSNQTASNCKSCSECNKAK